MSIRSTLLTGIIMISTAGATLAQGFVDQEAIAPLAATCGIAAGPITPVTWHEYTFTRQDKTVKATLARLQRHLDSLPGVLQGHRLEIVELSNRVRSKYMLQRQTLLIPDSFAEDFLAYAPYPQEYAADLDKVFIIDKYTQTFGAYENGRLVRWGLVSTGHDDDLTPNGRYTFNWKQEYRESSEAPAGEVWKLRWVFNFIESKGIHVHQYQLPIAMPASHGCVRLSEADAAWNYSWASQRSSGQPGTTVIVINHNPAGLSAHWMAAGMSLVNLPDTPMSIAPGMSNELAGW